jgi:hypothetical protein
MVQAIYWRNCRTLILQQPRITSLYIQLVHEAGDASAVWAVGNVAFCKVKYIEYGVTPESSTLKWVEDRQPNFNTPKVLAHAIEEDRACLFLQRLPG